MLCVCCSGEIMRRDAVVQREFTEAKFVFDRAWVEVVHRGLGLTLKHCAEH